MKIYFSKYGLDSITGLSDEDKKEMDCWKEHEGYVCGNKSGNNNCIMKITDLRR